MSKLSFCNDMLIDMGNRLMYFDNDAFTCYLNPTDQFKLVVCMAYFALTKEKIIDKDKKNHDPLGRIKSKVDRSKIEDLFSGEHAPTIISSFQSDPVWLLDAFRDSIMHEKFDINEEEKVVELHNDDYQREVDAIVPFEWFTDYIKNDIFQSRHTNKFKKNLFFHNSYFYSDNHIPTRNVINSSILYHVTVEGHELPLEELDNDIEQIMEDASHVSISENDCLQYKDIFNESNNWAEACYFITFLKAKDILREKLQEKYPGVIVKISIVKDKNKVIRKAQKMLNSFYGNYEENYHQLNHIVLKHKSSSLLHGILDLFDYIDHFEEHPKYDDLSLEEVRKEIIKIVNQEEDSSTLSEEGLYDSYQNSKLQLRYILLHLFGIFTLVANDEDFRKVADEINIGDAITAYSKGSFDNYCIQKRSQLVTAMKTYVAYVTQQNNVSRCKTEKDRIRVQELADECKEDFNHERYLLDRFDARYDDKIYPFDDKTQYIELVRQAMKVKLNGMLSTFFSCQDLEKLEEMSKDILDYYDMKVAYEKPHVFKRCSNSDALELIRNCICHFGRVNLKNIKGTCAIQLLSFYDFEEDDQKKGNNTVSGFGWCRFDEFLKIMYQCNQKQNQEKAKVYTK